MGGGGFTAALVVFAFYSKYLYFKYFKYLALQNFLLRIPPWKKIKKFTLTALWNMGLKIAQGLEG